MSVHGFVADVLAILSVKAATVVIPEEGSSLYALKSSTDVAPSRHYQPDPRPARSPAETDWSRHNI